MYEGEDRYFFFRCVVFFLETNNLRDGWKYLGILSPMVVVVVVFLLGWKSRTPAYKKSLLFLERKTLL